MLTRLFVFDQTDFFQVFDFETVLQFIENLYIQSNGHDGQPLCLARILQLCLRNEHLG